MSQFTLKQMKLELIAYNSIKEYKIWNRMCVKLLASDAIINSHLN